MSAQLSVPAVMFHHFFGANHPTGQGAISAQQLRAIIEDVGADNILDPYEWKTKHNAGSLKDTDLCLTFDDGLTCQYDVALPVLEEYGIKAFWFVYTSPLSGNIERLEVYRYFRNSCFESVDDFYAAFGTHLNTLPIADRVRRATRDFRPSAYLTDFPFYTNGDRWFRFIRDEILQPEEYFEAMDGMVENYRLDGATLTRRLFMNESHIAGLHDKGHIIGLHSHTHPTRLASLPAESQKQEYAKNQSLLTAITRAPVIAMSHPCNSYNTETLAVLESLVIEVGFRSNMKPLDGRSRLEVAREDHANVVERLAAKHA